MASSAAVQPDIIVDTGPVPIGASATGAVVAIGALAGIMPSLQPLLLAGFVDGGRLGIAAIGQIAMAEALGMAASVGLAGALLRPVGLRAKAAGVLACAALLNAAMPLAGGTAAIVALRVGVGLCSGLMLWLLIGLLARVALPTRVTGFYVVGQGAGAFLVSALLSSIVIPRWGIDGGYLLLAAIGAAAVPLALAVPTRFAPLEGGGGAALPTRIGAVGLAAASTHLAAIMAFWVYVVPVATGAGVGEAAVRVAVSIAIGAQIAAGAGAIRFATLPAARTLLCAIAAGIAGILLLRAAPPLALTIAGMLVFSIGWVFSLPYHVPFLIELDPTRRSVMLLTSVQLLGVAWGPMLASTAIGGGAAGAAAGVAIALFVAAALLVAIAQRLAPR